MDKVAVVNLGCPKNQIDAETMLGLLVEEGYQVTNRPEHAEIIIVNTCGFIDSARKESIDQILDVAQYKEVGNCRKLIVTGCLSQGYHQDLSVELPEVDAFLGTGSVDQIVSVVSDGKSVIGNPDTYNSLAESSRMFSTFPYGYLKIAEGCNNHCSYCVIPRLRGGLRSKQQDQILAEARRMVDGGLKEIVVIAQDSSQYGVDLTGRSLLPDLLRKLDAIDGLEWIRLLYCYPDHLSDELIDVLASSKKIVKYLDIPLQHSHGRILKSMGRNRKETDLKELVSKLRQRIPGIALRTTFIVGYPGESQEEFDDLLNFVKSAEFDHLGAFVYSREDNTPAGKMENQVSGKEKARRYHTIMEAQQKIVFKRNQSLIGQSFRVLVDRIEDGFAVARSYREAPEVDSHILVDDTNVKPGEFLQVRIVDFKDYDLLGVREDGQSSQ